MSLILVTAATGNVASHVVRALVESGQPVRAAVRSVDRAKEKLPAGIELVEFDLEKPETVAAAFDGVDRAFLATPLVENLADLDRACVEAATAKGVKHIVKLSVMGADTELDMLLAQKHREAEVAIENSGISYTILRPNSFHQNYITYCQATIQAQNAFYLPLGEASISLVDLRDVAAVAATVLTEDIAKHNGQAYLITGSEAISNGDVAKLLSEVLGREVQYIDVPESAAREAMQGAPEVQIDMVLGLYAQQKAGRYGTTSTTVQDVTGKASSPFRQFVHDFVSVF